MSDYLADSVERIFLRTRGGPATAKDTKEPVGTLLKSFANTV
jgi:hypothetical protein